MALSINIFIKTLIFYYDKTKVLIRLWTEKVQSDIVSGFYLGNSLVQRGGLTTIKLSEGILRRLLEKVIGMVWNIMAAIFTCCPLRYVIPIFLEKICLILLQLRRKRGQALERTSQTIIFIFHRLTVEWLWGRLKWNIFWLSTFHFTK